MIARRPGLCETGDRARRTGGLLAHVVPTLRATSHSWRWRNAISDATLAPNLSLGSSANLPRPLDHDRGEPAGLAHAPEIEVGSMHLADPSLAVAAVRASPARLLRRPRLPGASLRVDGRARSAGLCQAADAEVPTARRVGWRWTQSCRPTTGAGRFEVKLGEGRVDEGARNLLRLAERVDVGRMGEPMALGVIVSSGYGYTRRGGGDSGGGRAPVLGYCVPAGEC